VKVAAGAPCVRQSTIGCGLQGWLLNRLIPGPAALELTFRCRSSPAKSNDAGSRAAKLEVLQMLER